jgi:hypothetical protein
MDGGAQMPHERVAPAAHAERERQDDQDRDEYDGE